MTFKHIVFVIFLWSFSFSIFAQTDLALGLNAGTKGIGADLAFSLSNALTLRAGAHYFKYEKENIDTDFGLNGFNYDLDVNVKQLNIEGIIELGLFDGLVRAMGGIAYFSSQDFQGQIMLREGINFNGIMVTPEEAGAADILFEYEEQISPYIGLGLGRAVPKKRVGISLELGGYYRGNQHCSYPKKSDSNLRQKNPLNLLS